jgi:uncharacterized LabA/DUF88 family protein
MARVRAYVDGYNFYYSVKDAYRDAGNIGLGWCNFRRLLFATGLASRQDDEVTVKYFTAEVKEDDPWHEPRGERYRQLTWLRAVQSVPGLSVVYGRHKPIKSPPSKGASRLARLRSTKRAVHEFNVILEKLLAAEEGRKSGQDIPELDEAKMRKDWDKVIAVPWTLLDLYGWHLKPPGKSREEKQTDVNIAVAMLLDASANEFDRAVLLSADTDLVPATFALQHGHLEHLGRIKALPVWQKPVTVLVPPGQHLGKWHSYYQERKGKELHSKQIRETDLARSLLPYSITGAFSCLDEWKLTKGYLEKNVPDNLRPDIQHQDPLY